MIADNLNKLENDIKASYNELKQIEISRLPKEYQEVEYIESTGTQYIDTGITKIFNCEIELIAQQTELLSGFSTLLGANVSSSTFKVVFGYGSNSRFYSQSPNSGNDFIQSDVQQDILKHTFKYIATTNNVELLIDSISNSNNYITSTDTTVPLYLFARNKISEVSNYSKQKVFMLSFKDNNGKYIKKFIPCYRKSDNEIGLYDLVENKFYTNQGAGTFLKGKDIFDYAKNTNNLPTAINNAITTIKSYIPSATSENGICENAIPLNASAEVDGNSKQGENPSPDYPQDIEVIDGWNMIDYSMINTFVLQNTGYYYIAFPSNKTILDGKFKKNTQYTISFNGYGNSSRNGIFRFAYDDGTIQEIVIRGTTPTNYSITSFENKTISNIKITWGEGNSTFLKDLILIKGTEPKPYLPYGHIGLRQTNEDGSKEKIYDIDLADNSIARIGDIKDLLNINEKGIVELEKNIGKVVLKGDENWLSTSYQGIINGYLPIDSIKPGVNIALSNYFIYSQTALKYGCFSISGTMPWIIIQNITDINDLKTWLSTHNTEVYYELATPQKLTLPTTEPIKMWEGTNNFELITNLDTTYRITYYTRGKVTPPKPYTELEYIESTGTQYIDIGIKSDTIQNLEFKFMPTSLANRYQAYLSAYPDNFTVGAFESLTRTFLRYRTREIYRVQYISSIKPTTIAVYSDGIYFNGDRVSARLSTDTAISTTSDNLFIASTSLRTVPAAMRFYGLALTDLSGNLIADIIPVKHDGVVCVYDTVRKIYLTNSGTGEFIAGPEKTEE